MVRRIKMVDDFENKNDKLYNEDILDSGQKNQGTSDSLTASSYTNEPTELRDGGHSCVSSDKYCEKLGDLDNPYRSRETVVENGQIQRDYYGINFAPLNNRVNNKFPVGLVVFLLSAVLAVVLCVCIILTVFFSNISSIGKIDERVGNGFGYQIPTSGDFDKFFNDASPGEGKDALDANDVLDTTCKDAPQIKLYGQPGDIFSNGKYTAKYAYDKSKQSVVGIIAYDNKDKSSVASEGTGIVISENGYIVTNSHVISNSRTKYKITVKINDEEFDAQVTGYDSRTDIAVLKIEKTGLLAADFANSDEVQIGQDIVAIGNPGGLQFSNSITRGIISAVNRDVSHGNVSYIQTDAAINPGNSGGPLLNMSGQVIGITTVKIVTTGYEGMGFAIPSRQATSVIDNIIKHGYVVGRVRIGVTGNEIVNDSLSSYNISSGIYVISVDEQGPLARTGIKPGDIITKIDGVEVTGFSVIFKELDKHSAGDIITLTYRSASASAKKYNEEITIDVKLQEDVVK